MSHKAASASALRPRGRVQNPTSKALLVDLGGPSPTGQSTGAGARSEAPPASVPLDPGTVVVPPTATVLVESFLAHSFIPHSGNAQSPLPVLGAPGAHVAGANATTGAPGASNDLTITTQNASHP